MTWTTFLFDILYDNFYSDMNVPCIKTNLIQGSPSTMYEQSLRSFDSHTFHNDWHCNIYKLTPFNM